MQKKNCFALLLAGVLVASLSPQIASAAPANGDNDVPSYLMPVESGEAFSTEPLTEEHESGLPQELASRVLSVEVAHPELNITGTKWLDDEGLLEVYSSASRESMAAALKSNDLSAAVRHVDVVRDRSEVQAAIRELVGDSGVLESGHRVVMAAPALDGSRVDVTLDSSAVAQARSFDGTAPAVPEEVNGIPISVTFGEPALETPRNHDPGASGDRFSGAYMRTSSNACSTGFSFVDTRNANEPSMISAHHCGNYNNEPWFYSSLNNPQYPMGTFRGQAVPPANGVFPDLAAWKGAGMSQFAPGIIIGNNTVSASVVRPIYGAGSAPVNSAVCYTGSFSGNVCSNVVQNIGVTICYSNSGTCYENLTQTRQVNGTPAAGSGDSGGPVYFTNSNNIYAAGIISGILSPSATCTGDPGGTADNARKCSASVLFSPLVDALQSGYSLRVIR